MVTSAVFFQRFIKSVHDYLKFCKFFYVCRIDFTGIYCTNLLKSYGVGLYAYSILLCFSIWIHELHSFHLFQQKSTRDINTDVYYICRQLNQSFIRGKIVCETFCFDWTILRYHLTESKTFLFPEYALAKCLLIVFFHGHKCLLFSGCVELDYLSSLSLSACKWFCHLVFPPYVSFLLVFFFFFLFYHCSPANLLLNS